MQQFNNSHIKALHVYISAVFKQLPINYKSTSDAANYRAVFVSSDYKDKANKLII